MARPASSKVGTIRLGWDVLECLSPNENTTNNANPIYRVRCVECDGVRTLRYRSFTLPCTCKQGVHAGKVDYRKRDPLLAGPRPVPNVVAKEAEVYRVMVCTFFGGYKAWFRGLSLYSAYAKIPEDAKPRLQEAIELLPDGVTVPIDVIDLAKGSVGANRLVKASQPSAATLNKLASRKAAGEATDEMSKEALLQGLQDGLTYQDKPRVAEQVKVVPPAALSRPVGTTIEVVTPKTWSDDYAPPV